MLKLPNEYPQKEKEVLISSNQHRERYATLPEYYYYKKRDDYDSGCSS